MAEDIEAARNTAAPKIALMELIASNQLRKRAAQDGCLSEEIEAAWSSAGERDAALNKLISQYSQWRTKQLQQLAEMEVVCLVDTAKRTGGVAHEALEDARDDEAPQQALARLLLGAPGFVAEQRKLYLDSLKLQVPGPRTQRTPIGGGGGNRSGLESHKHAAMVSPRLRHA